MIFKYINFRVFLISLVLGVLVVYLYQPLPTTIYVYPTPDNGNNILYKDKAQNCYKFKATNITCPKDKKNIYTIPMQE